MARVRSGLAPYLASASVLDLAVAFFFVLTFAIKAFTDGPYVRGEISAGLAYTKYATALAACFFALAAAWRKGERRFVREFNELAIIVALFAVASFLLQMRTGVFAGATYVELVKFAMPILLAYLVLNALDEDMIYRTLVLVLLVCVVGYVVDLRDQGASPLDIFAADFDTSSSKTESSGFAEISLLLALYFMYYRKYKLPLVLAVVFSILTFKRLALLVTIIAFVISTLLPRLMYARVPRRLITLCKVLTLAVTAAWFWLLLPQQEALFIQMFGKSPFEFTMGRSESMRYLLSSGFQSYGFGSSNDVINSVFGVPFEMDLIKIAFELTPVVLVVFVWLFWDVAGTSFWGFFIVGYYMVNMITSDSLTSNFSFTLAYMVIGLMNEDQLLRFREKDEELNLHGRGWRKLFDGSRACRKGSTE